MLKAANCACWVPPARAAVLPDTPTIAEAGVPGYAVDVWYAMLAPAATARTVLVPLNTEVTRVLHVPDVRDRLASMGLEAVGEGLEASAKYIASEIARCSKVVKSARISAE